VTAGDPHEEELPAWSLPAAEVERVRLDARWPHPLTREWAWGDGAGRGVRVCIVDSGIETDHPAVGDVQRSVSAAATEDGVVVEDDDAGDLSGHGTACAGIVRSLAPECELVSVRVLGPRIRGSGAVLLAGLEWAVEQGFEVINLSLSTRRADYLADLHHLADRAYFRRSMIVASAHNMLVESFPWRFASVLSVASHEERDPLCFYYNPEPPVEFFARGLDVDIAWSGGQRIVATGNSFATPHIAGICARILGEHPGLTPFQLKSVLYLIADNVR
jgi:subtilisin family serine protease